LIHLPPGIVLAIARILGLFLGDMLLTADEIAGLMANTLVTPSQPAGRTSLSQWAVDNGGSLGKTYHSEIRRHYKTPAD
jgi:NADH dehydrogenase